MQLLLRDHLCFKPFNFPRRFLNPLLIILSVCAINLFLSTVLFKAPSLKFGTSLSTTKIEPTSLNHIVFGIASNSKSWPKRRDLLRLWWTHQSLFRGCVFMDSIPNVTLSGNESSLDWDPPLCVSEDTSRFKYTFRNGGLRSAIRVARVVSEIVALNHSDVRWFVFGDDDTVLFPENLVKTLSKYDHELWYYIGANSEIYEQNNFFYFNMAFGGAGFAISYPLARVLARVFDSCLERYPHLYGSDGRIYSCLAELGVGLTREPGFHQMDFRGDVFGYLASHPTTPLVSLHHLDYLDPIFPNRTIIGALEHLLKAVQFDSQRILQQTICYDPWFSWTISLSWGYAAQVFEGHMFLPDVLPVQRTFRQWTMGARGNILARTYNFNTRLIQRDPCKRASVFFLHNVSSNTDGIIESRYTKAPNMGNCSVTIGSPKKLDEVRVFSTKLDLHINQLMAPRRQCCDVLPSSVGRVLELGIRNCREDELIQMPA